MNTLAKVLIVLVFLLSAIFTGSQVVLYGKRENYGKKYVEAAKVSQDLAARLQTAEAALADKTAELDATKGRLGAEVSALNENLAGEQARSADLSNQGKELTASVQMLTNRASKLEEDIITRDATMGDLRDTVAAREISINEHEARISALADDVQDKLTEVATLNVDLANVKKDRTELAESHARLESIVKEFARAGHHIPRTHVPIINGRVVSVDSKLGSAVINKGKTDKVKPNTPFTVYRNGTYVATLNVHDVEKQISVGRYGLLAEGQQVRVGDMVTTEIR